MKRKIALLVAGLMLSSCTTTGGLATSASGIDKPATLKATCDGIAKADVAFQAFAKARPGVIDANGMSVEGAVMATILPVCTVPYAGDVDVAINTAIAALIQVSTLLANWKT